MKNYYFTFGIGQPLQNYFQQIVAENMGQAEEKMIEKWGRGWAFGYTQEDFLNDDYFKKLKPLKPLYATRCMTFGEMRGFTEKLHQILNTDCMNRDERLRSLASVLDNAFQKNDKYA